MSHVAEVRAALEESLADLEHQAAMFRAALEALGESPARRAPAVAERPASARARRGSKSARRKTATDDLVQRVAGLLPELQPASTAALSEKLGVGPEAVRGVLVRLEAEGQARREGVSRHTRWHAAA